MEYLNGSHSFAAHSNINTVDLEKYIIEISDDFLFYFFFSIGPKGKIKKAVRFKLIWTESYNYFNLAFGDWNEVLQDIDDLVVTDNHDTDKILATVANIVMEFSKHYSESFIHIEGSTETRTRLYQMKINKYWEEIEVEFELYAFVEKEGIIPYKPGIKCLKFVGRKKLK